MTIEYFYSAHSAFAYLGSARLMEIARLAGRRIVHRPIDLDIVVPATGASRFAERSDDYRRYFFQREIQRWSEQRKAPVAGRPTWHHHNTTRVNCLLIAGTLADIDIDHLAHALLEAHWRYDADLDDEPTLRRIAAAAGYDADRLLRESEADAVRAVYRANNEEAISRSVFGSPTYFVDGDMFYGQDRLEMVERALREPYSREWTGG